LTYSNTASRRRERNEIKIDILRAAARESRPTRIMSLSNLQTRSFRDAMKDLVDGDLLRVEEIKGRKSRTRLIYRITEKGVEAIRRWNQLEGILNMKTEEAMAT